MLLVVDKHVDDLRQVERDGAVLGGQVVPARRPSALRNRASSSGATRALSTWPPRKPIADLLGLLVAMVTARLGWTISVRTPPVDAGCRKATREPRIPIRGCCVDQPQAGAGERGERALALEPTR